MKKLYIIAMIIGAALPLYFFTQHFMAHGFGLPAFFAAGFANPVATGLATDLLLSVALGLIIIWRDAKRLGVRGFWLVVLGTCLIGFSFGLPLYLYLRETRVEAAGFTNEKAWT
jgi:hypothetical protein